jgi:hypothetical protein
LGEEFCIATFFMMDLLIVGSGAGKEIREK